MAQIKQVDKYNIEFCHEAAAMWFVYTLRFVCAGVCVGGGATQIRGWKRDETDKYKI